MIAHEVEPCGCRIGVHTRPDSTWEEGNLKLTILYCGAHHAVNKSSADLKKARAEILALRRMIRNIEHCLGSTG